MAKLTPLLRGARLRCARCGGGDLFASFFSMREACPTCGLKFSREDGYWLGAMSINIVATALLYLGGFVGAMVVTWPDVPWTTLLVVGLVVAGAFPVLFFRHSRTLWLGLDHAFFPATVEEEADALTRLAAPRDEG